ncbi:hypothetical protein HDU93_008374 [Gonapodya sp. JEL0774]|nr:hypothetical protein HDU93_008374 [Gonapodya sp. JEL0774]
MDPKSDYFELTSNSLPGSLSSSESFLSRGGPDQLPASGDVPHSTSAPQQTPISPVSLTIAPSVLPHPRVRDAPGPDMHIAPDSDKSAEFSLLAEKPAATTEGVDVIELEDIPPDGGFEGWAVVGAYWFISFVSVGLIYVWSIYLRFYFRNDSYPGTPQSVYSITGGAANSAGFLAGPLLGSLADRYGYRPIVFLSTLGLGASYLVTSFAGPGDLWLMVMFQGIVQGISSQGAWMVAMAAIPQYFKKRRGIAMGIAMTGAGMGGLALTNLTQYLLDRLGPAWTLRISGFVVLGGVFAQAMNVFEILSPELQSLMFSRTIVMTPATFFVRTRLPPKRKGKLLDLQAFRDIRFVLLFLSGITMYFAYPLPQFFMTSYATSIGVDTQTAALILGLQFAITAPTRIVYGLLMDKIGPVNVFLACNYFGGIICLTLWPSAKSLGSLMAFAMIFGATGGQFFSQIPIVISSIFGHHDSATKMGMVLLSLSMGSLLGTLAGGKLLDTHTTPNLASPTGYDQDFVPVMIYTGVLYLISSTIMLILRWNLVGWTLRVKLIIHDRIVTTVAKAKEVQKWAEKAIDVAGRGTNAAKLKMVGRVFNHHLTIPKLFSELKYRYGGQKGPYTHIHLLGVRPHDKAPRAILELRNSPRDLEYLSAKLNIDKLRTELESLDTAIQSTEAVARSFLPSSSVPSSQLPRSLRTDIYLNPSGRNRNVPVSVQLDRARELRKLQSRRKTLHNLIAKMEDKLTQQQRAEESRRLWTESELQSALRRKQEALEGVAARIKAYERLGGLTTEKDIRNAILEAGQTAMIGLQTGRVQSLTWDDWIRYRDTGSVTAVDVREVQEEAWRDPSVKRPVKEPKSKKKVKPLVPAKAEKEKKEAEEDGKGRVKENSGYLKGVWDRVKGMSMLKNRVFG